jgi:hypothetical protein
MLSLRAEIVGVERSIGGDVPDHAAVAVAIPRFFLGGEAFGVLEREGTPMDIEESNVGPLLLRLLGYVRFVNLRNLRDPQDLEWWEEGLCGSLLYLVSLADDLGYENYPSFLPLLVWRRAIEHDSDDSYQRYRSDSEEVDLPDGSANDAPREQEVLARRYTDRVAAHELGAYLSWMSLDGNEQHRLAYQSFREDLRHALLIGTYPFSPLSVGEITDLQIRRLSSNLFGGEDGDGDL